MTPCLLFVDDDEALRGSVRRLLERAGYEVMEAGNVMEARIEAERKCPDLLIMDLVLPGMEGREVANLIRAHCLGLPVLFVSGYTNQESVQLQQLVGGDQFLRKPFTPKELLGAVQKGLATRDR